MKYCWECGNKLILKECFNCSESEGLVPYCEKCGTFRFPIFNTAVSMVVFNKDFSKSLLIQQYNRGVYGLVAGYVEKGENLLQTLIRELKEETNLNAISFKFNESKYFDKTNTLMCNFMVQAESEDIKTNSEIDEAHWFDISTACKNVYPNSLAGYFLDLAVEKISKIQP